MTALDKLDATATDTLVRYLSHHFGMKMPRLTIGAKRANHGFNLGRRVHVARGAELWVLLHEFAHYRDGIVNRSALRAHLYLTNVPGGFCVRRPHTQAIHHGDSFYYILKHVIEAAGVQDYPWTREYRNLARWAAKDGLIVGN